MRKLYYNTRNECWYIGKIIDRGKIIFKTILTWRKGEDFQQSHREREDNEEGKKEWMNVCNILASWRFCQRGGVMGGRVNHFTTEVNFLLREEQQLILQKLPITTSHSYAILRHNLKV